MELFVIRTVILRILEMKKGPNGPFFNFEGFWRVLLGERECGYRIAV